MAGIVKPQKTQPPIPAPARKVFSFLTPHVGSKAAQENNGGMGKIITSFAGRQIGQPVFADSQKITRLPILPIRLSFPVQSTRPFHQHRA